MICPKCGKDRWKSFDLDYNCCVNCGELALIPVEPMPFDKKPTRAKVKFSTTPSKDIIYQHYDDVIAPMRTAEQAWDVITEEMIKVSGQTMSSRTVQKYSFEIQQARNVPEPGVGRIFKKSMDIAGQRFGRLVAKEKHRDKWHCVCDCGGSKLVVKNSLVQGWTKSCGCIKAGVKC